MIANDKMLCVLFLFMCENVLIIVKRAKRNDREKSICRQQWSRIIYTTDFTQHDHFHPFEIITDALFSLSQSKWAVRFI